MLHSEVLAIHESYKQMLLQLGRGARMAKIDVANAFRNVPVHPQDRHLLGLVWNDDVYFDKLVPFGLRSAPILFNAYADALEWILRRRGCNYMLHYFDDFLIIGKPDSDACAKHLDTIISVCHGLGIPLAMDQCKRNSFSRHIYSTSYNILYIYIHIYISYQFKRGQVTIQC